MKILRGEPHKHTALNNTRTHTHTHTHTHTPKSLWNPPTGHRNCEVSLSQIEHELFQIPD